MRRYVISEPEMERLSSIGLVDATAEILDGYRSPDHYLQLERAPGVTPYYSNYDAIKWRPNVFRSARQSLLGRWYDQADQDSISLTQRCTVYPDQRNGRVGYNGWMRTKEGWPGLPFVLPDIAVTTGVAAMELFRREKATFEGYKSHGYPNKLSMAQNAAAMIIQQAEWLGRRWSEQYLRDFNEVALTSDQSSTKRAISTGMVGLDDPRLVIQAYKWFEKGSLEPIRQAEVGFSPKACEAQISLYSPNEIPHLLANCMAFLDFAGVPQAVQFKMVAAAANRAYQRDTKPGAVLFAEVLDSEGEALGDATELLAEVSNPQRLIDQPRPHLPELPSGSYLLGHDLFCTRVYGWNNNERVVIRYTNDDRPLMTIYQGEVQPSGYMTKRRTIELDVQDIGPLVESLIMTNKFSSTRTAPAILPYMLNLHYGIQTIRS